MTAIIEVHELVKQFGDFTAVAGINFEVAEGEFFGFLGPNGAGKTTTINILATLLQPTPGRASLAGFDILTQPNQVRQSIGMVFQDQSLDNRLTVDEHLLFHAMLYNVFKRPRSESIDLLLSSVGPYDRPDAMVTTVSGA